MKKSYLFLGLSLAIVLDTAGQLLWKFSANSLPQTLEFNELIAAITAQPYFLAVGVIFFVQLFNWLFVLDNADLSYAQPITSLSYVSVCGFSALWFGEHIGVLKAIGIFCVLLGVLFLSMSKPNSSPKDKI